MHSRRFVLSALGSSLVLGSMASRALAQPESRIHLHQALVYARNNQLSFWSLQGQKYGAVDGELVHLWDIETIIAATSAIDAEGALTARVFETFYAFEPGTETPLQTLSNPFTGQETPFPAYPARPVDQLYSKTSFTKQTETPVGLMTADTSIAERIGSPGVAQLDIEKRITLDRNSGSAMRIHEFLAYSAPKSSYNPDYGFNEAALELTIWSDWLPWMSMEDIPGGLFTRAQGRKLDSFADLPEAAATPLARDYPALVKDPRTFLSPT